MQRIAYSKKIICYLFILCIALTSAFSTYGECGVFSMQRQQTYCSRQTVQGAGLSRLLGLVNLSNT